MIARWPSYVALILMWIALWGDFTIANIIGGALVATAVLWFARNVRPRRVRHFRVRAAALYAVTFTRQLVLAAWGVVLAVIQPGRIRPGIVAMPLRYASDAVVTLVANSISLTPGTLTLEIERQDDTAILYVHALDLRQPDSIRADICQLEKLAVDAFAGHDAQVVQARSLAEYEERGAGERAAADGSDSRRAAADGSDSRRAAADGSDSRRGDGATHDRRGHGDRAPVDDEEEHR